MATFLNDTFTDTDGVALASHTGETGATWTKHPLSASGAVLIAANRIYPSASIAIFYASGSPANGDYDVTATVRIASAINVEMGICGRLSTSADNYYLMNLLRTSGVWASRLYSVAGGAFTQLGTDYTPATPSVGSDHTLKLSMIGNQISGYYDGVLRLGPFTNTATSAAGKAGVRFVTAVTSTTGLHIADIAATDALSVVNKPLTIAVKRAGFY